MVSDKVKKILLNKMTIIKQSNTKDICLVGPIKLPVKIDNQDITFQWYTWLSLEGFPAEKESLLESLATADLAKLQQSSVLVYGDFRIQKMLISGCIVFVIQEIFLVVSVVIAGTSCINP